MQKWTQGQTVRARPYLTISMTIHAALLVMGGSQHTVVVLVVVASVDMVCALLSNAPFDVAMGMARGHF